MIRGLLNTDYLKKAMKGVRSFLHMDDDGPPLAYELMAQLAAQDKIAEWLPYSRYIEDQSLFVTPDGVGFVLELAPLIGVGLETTNLLSGLFMDCPTGTGVEISMFGDNNLLPLFKAYANLCPEDERPSWGGDTEDGRNKNIFRALARRRIDFYLKGTRNELFPERNIVFLNKRLFISVVVPGDGDDVALQERAASLRESMRQTCMTAGMSSFVWTADDLVDFLFTIFNPSYMYADRPRDDARTYDPDREIRHQVVARNTRVQFKPSYVKFKTGDLPAVHARLYSVVSYPRTAKLWETIGVLGDDFHAALRYPCPFLITLGVHVEDHQKTKARAMMQGARAVQNAESAMAKFQHDLQEKKDDWTVVNMRLAEGHGIVKMYHQVMVFARPQDLNRADSSVKAIWRARGFTLDADQFMQAQALLATIPLSLSPAFTSDLVKAERITTKTSFNALHTMPIAAEWRGYGNPVLLFWGRNGQPAWTDLYDNPQGNYNAAVSGVPGAGKSVLMNEFALRYRAVGAKVFIIDVGRSYEKLCRIPGLDGTYIEFTRTNPICINPFSWVHPDPLHDEGILEAIKMIKPLVARMADPKACELDGYGLGRIEESIFSVWERKKNSAEVTDVADWLREAILPDGSPDQRARDIAVKLFPYTKHGMYGRFFSGPATIDLRSQFIVLELEELKSSKDLQTVVMFVVMYRITTEMYLSRNSRKIALIDEAWSLMGSDGAAADFVEEGYRRARKYKGSFIAATQGINDYFATPAAEAAFKCADWKFYLRQDAAEVERLEREKKLVLSGAEKRALLSLRKEDGIYSEMLVTSPVGRGLERLIIDPFAIKLASSKAEDFEEINYHRDQGMDIIQAISTVLEREASQNAQRYRH